MPNFDGMWEVTIVYDTVPTGFQLLEHTLTFDVDVTATPEVGEPFTAINIAVRNGAPILLSDAVDDFVAGMIALYPATSTIIRAELNFIPEGEYAKQFYSSYPIDEVGTNGTASQPAHQATFTFRSLGGGSGRLQFMESSMSGNTKTSYPYSSASRNAIADLVTGNSGFFLARDNTFMFSNLHLSEGQNERLFRKRFRS